MVDALGFSAGGHLAASLATGFEEHLHKPVDAIDGLDPRPRSVGLIYPVISHERGIGHAESSARLLGAHPGPALVERRSPVLHVGARSEEHTSELQSLMRTSYAVFCLNK